MISIHDVKRVPVLVIIGLVAAGLCGLLLLSRSTFRSTIESWSSANKPSPSSTVTKSQLRDVLSMIHGLEADSHLRVDERAAALRLAAEEAFSTYLCGDGAAVLAYIDTSVIELATPSDMERHRGWGQFTGWFWSSLRLAEGEATFRPAVVAGVPQQLRTDGENNMISLRTKGLPCFSDPKSTQFSYEVRIPVMYNTPDGNEHRVSLGLFFQWDNRKQDWVQTGSSMYGFPVNQPLVRLPG